ncbi:MAG: non-canonical purine NTP diphosphatase [Bacteroidales bacterium]
MNLIFASNNPHKLREVRDIFGNTCHIFSLNDVDIHEDIKESATSLEGNAAIKADYVYHHLKKPCFADDTGLEVYALNKAPGVHSARYAGNDQNSQENLKKLMHEMKAVNNRKARFRTVVCLIIKDNHYFFEGIAEGSIAPAACGTAGFGYDPVFIPDGYNKTFAEMGDEEKNLISHRAKAIRKLARFIKDGNF